MNRPWAGGEFFCPTVTLPFQARSVVGGTQPPIRLAFVNRRLNLLMYGSVSSFLVKQQLQPTKYLTQAMPVSAEPT